MSFKNMQRWLEDRRSSAKAPELSDEEFKRRLEAKGVRVHFENGTGADLPLPSDAAPPSGPRRATSTAAARMADRMMTELDASEDNLSRIGEFVAEYRRKHGIPEPEGEAERRRALGLRDLSQPPRSRAYRLGAALRRLFVRR